LKQIATFARGSFATDPDLSGEISEGHAAIEERRKGEEANPNYRDQRSWRKEDKFKGIQG
jgi:hypothetical protein